MTSAQAPVGVVIIFAGMGLLALALGVIVFLQDRTQQLASAS